VFRRLRDVSFRLVTKVTRHERREIAVPCLHALGTGTVRLYGWSYADIHTNDIDLDILILRTLTAGEYKVDFINPSN
jgi:hypothetical protein